MVWREPDNTTINLHDRKNLCLYKIVIISMLKSILAIDTSQ